METKTLFVKSTTNPSSLGSAIAHAVYEKQPVEIRAIGAGALSVACKGLTVARGFVAPRGVDLLVRLGFTEVEFPDKTMTALTFEVVVR